jgi:integrase/recombinase XerD
MSSRPALPARVVDSRVLTAPEFHELAEVPPEMEWFDNLGNKATRRAYQTALKDFMRFTGIRHPASGGRRNFE